MWVVVGLGNPGGEYGRTRHNLGAVTVAELARRLRCRFRSGEGDFLWAKARTGGEELLLSLTTTYMNMSGKAVAGLLRERHAEPGELVIVADDFYLPLGRLRLRAGGGDGGHKGIASVIEALASDGFPRLRMGIGEPPAEAEPADWVLEPFDSAEVPLVEKMVGRALDALEVLAREGMPRAMDLANRWPKDPAQDPVQMNGGRGLSA